MNMNDKEYEEISSTAIVTSYPRIFTDIPYEKEIYEWLSSHCNEEVTLNKMLAPEIEARYKLTNKLLDNSNIKQVLELAAGYSSRGLIYSSKGYNYVEMDLEKVSNNKINIIKTIEKNIPKSLSIIGGNALRSSDYTKCDEYFEESKPVAVINEGLLRYLTFDEKRTVAENVYSFLKKHGGIWITCDVTPKKFIQSQDKALPNFNKNLNNITSRNSLNDRFENIEHIKQFFGDIGFEVAEVRKFSEMKEELYSINHNNIIDSHIEQSLGDAIVVVMKLKEEKVWKNK
jgi:O-methyltransferase involved in polyketide biosynthesis